MTPTPEPTARPTDRNVVRLDDLTPEQRRLVLALIEAAKSEAKRKENDRGR